MNSIALREEQGRRRRLTNVKVVATGCMKGCLAGPACWWCPTRLVRRGHRSRRPRAGRAAPDRRQAGRADADRAAGLLRLGSPPDGERPRAGGQPRAAHACVRQPTQEEANHRAQPLQLIPGEFRPTAISRAGQRRRCGRASRLDCPPLRCGPGAGGCPPRGRSLGHALPGSPTRGPMGCPGGRQARAHPAHRRIRTTPPSSLPQEA
jgi:hypothetical protein